MDEIKRYGCVAVTEGSPPLPDLGPYKAPVVVLAADYDALKAKLDALLHFDIARDNRGFYVRGLWTSGQPYPTFEAAAEALIDYALKDTGEPWPGVPDARGTSSARRTATPLRNRQRLMR